MPAKRTPPPASETIFPITEPPTKEHPTAKTRAATPAGGVRRISNPRPKKPAELAAAPGEPAIASPEAAATESAPAAVEPAARPPITTEREPEFPDPEPTAPVAEADDDEITEPPPDWPYEAETVGDPPQEGDKRNKRRRRKGKGGQGGGPGGQQQQGQRGPRGPQTDDPEPQPATQPDKDQMDRDQPERGRPDRGHPDKGQPRQGQPRQDQGQQPRPPQATRSKVDPELLARHAWKIFLAEVSEEGIALISDHDARELTRRCFRLAEIFLEEQTRRA
jgi:hypothetical protein